MKRIVGAAVAATVAVPVLVGVAQAGSDRAPGAGDPWHRVTGKQARIANALSAGPKAVVAGATVLDYGSKATDPYVTLQKGKGAWTCFPDWPASPGNDPICYDRQGMKWLTAYNLGKKPHLTGPGVAYRLQGGSDPSLTDPAALEPATGGHWIEHGPHIVVVSPGRIKPSDYGSYGDDAWVMFPGTPYEHLHLPVGDDSRHMH